MKKNKITQNVNKDKIFNDLPKVHPLTSKWMTRHSNYQSCNIGQIVPIYYDEVLPGERRKVSMAMCSHTTTPIAPIFNSLYTEIRAFFVPFRLCADLLNGYKTRKSPWVKVFGEDPDSTSSDIIVKLEDQKLPEFTGDHQFIVDIFSYFDNPPDSKDNVFDSLDIYDRNYDDPDKEILTSFNYLNLASYELIYQRHYRNENFESATSSILYQLLFDAYNADKASVTLPTSFTFEISNREKDYFTGMKPFTQKGDPVTVHLAEKAPVYSRSESIPSDLISGTPLKMGRADTGEAIDEENATLLGMEADGLGVNAYSSNTLTKGLGAAPINLWADLKAAQGIPIEELRLLIKTQELLEKDAIYGSLYAESLNAHFGCCPIDLTLQDPVEIYKTIITSNMQAIFQTSTTKDEASILGTIGANSTTQTDKFVILPETKFEEHGIIMICAVHKLQNVYDTTFFKPRMNFKNSRFDFYTPELNDLGYQKVLGGKEAVKLPSTAGFNEAFAEYRYKFNKKHGNLNDEFKYWAPAISDDYESAAVLYKEDPGILDQALSVYSTTAPQFYDAWGFEEENTKPMSLHSIPGFDGVI